MTRSDDRKTALVDRLADHVLAEGLAGSSLRPLAKAAGTSDRMLLYHFKDKTEVIGAVLERVAARMAMLLNSRAAKTPLPLERLRTELAPVLLADEMWPYMRLWLEIASLAARGDPLFRRVGEGIARGFLAWGAAQLDSAAPDEDAARLLVTMEGMVLLKSVGLEDECRRVM